MATNRLFTFNNGPSIGDALQYGNLAISTSSFDGYKWWPGPDEDLGYVIAHDDTNPNMRTEGARSATVSTNSVGFWRTSVKSNAAFLTMANELLGQNFVDVTTATDWLLANGYWTSYDPNSILGTIDLPASSAQALYDAGQTTDGWYYIQTSNMASSRQIYCNMTDEGGGWMLMTYCPKVGEAYWNMDWNGGLGGGYFNSLSLQEMVVTSARIPYPNQWLGVTGSFEGLSKTATYDPEHGIFGFTYSSPISIDVREVWYHNGTAQCTQVMRMASSATNSLTPLLSNMEIANKVVYSNPNNLLLSATFSHRGDPSGFSFNKSYAISATSTPMSGTWSAIKGHTLMTGPLNVNAPSDWIWYSGSYWEVCGSSTLYPDPYGRTPGVAEFFGTSAKGDIGGPGYGAHPVISGMADVVDNVNSNRQDIITYAIFIK